MHTLTLITLVLTVLGITSAYWVNDVNRYEDDNGDDSSSSLEALFKRTARRPYPGEKLCIPWRAPCIIDKKLQEMYKFLVCCGDNFCKCTIWGNNCRCEARLG